MKNAILEIPSLHPYGKAYRISFEKKEPSLEYQMLSKEDVKRFEELYVKVQEKPKKNIKSLRQLSKDFPDVPEITNLLTYAYLRLKKKKDAERLVESAWKTHPNHFSARINYADQAIRLRRKELIPIIFEGCMDLHAHNPQKECFHYSEFRGFMVVMGFYHLSNNEKEKAEECYQLAFQVDPLHSSVAALEKKISNEKNPRLLKKCFQMILKLARISKNP